MEKRGGGGVERDIKVCLRLSVLETCLQKKTIKGTPAWNGHGSKMGDKILFTRMLIQIFLSISKLTIICHEIK